VVLGGIEAWNCVFPSIRMDKEIEQCMKVGDRRRRPSYMALHRTSCAEMHPATSWMYAMFKEGCHGVVLVCVRVCRWRVSEALKGRRMVRL
jgi:hypothetical protein